VSTQSPTIEILGVPLTRIDRETALREIERLYERDAPALVVYANAHTLNLASRDPGYRLLLRGADIVLNDGIGVQIAARIQGTSFVENLNGSDFNPEIAALAAARRWPVYFLGAGEGVAAKAATVLQARLPGLEVVGTHHGFFAPSEGRAIAESIRASGAGLVMVGMGNPRQERWLAEHLAETGARMGVGVGFFFDFEAGTAPRAPQWMNRFGVEWVWRLLQEPKRLWKRYIVGNPVFLYRVLRERLSRH
jgi:N-acetylglucosaminyldiphosphoundecaprenol N-acetyl-beta-D-mannosaminyltransferase